MQRGVCVTNARVYIQQYTASNITQSCLSVIPSSKVTSWPTTKNMAHYNEYGYNKEYGIWPTTTNMDDQRLQTHNSTLFLELVGWRKS